MSEHDLLAIRMALREPGANSVQMEPEVLAWMVDEIFRLRDLKAGLENALEDALVREFAASLETDTPPGKVAE